MDVCVDAENVVTTARERDGEVRDDVGRFVSIERAGDEEGRPVSWGSRFEVRAETLKGLLRLLPWLNRAARARAMGEAAREYSDHRRSERFLGLVARANAVVEALSSVGEDQTQGQPENGREGERLFRLR